MIVIYTAYLPKSHDIIDIINLCCTYVSMSEPVVF